MANDVMTVRSVRAGGLNPVRLSELPATTDMLVYGPPKLGKTTFALTAQDVPEMGNYLHVAIEKKGDETIRYTYPDTNVLYTSVDDNGRPLETDLAKWERFEYIYEELRAGGHGFDTVALDTLDELQAINISAIMEETPSVQEGKQDKDIPSKREYGKSRTQMKRVIRMFQDLPMNVIWIAHAKTDQDERTKRYSKKPALVGQFQDEVGGMVSNLLYFSMYGATKEAPATRVLITASDGEIQAGTRSRVLNDMGQIEDPTMAKFWYPLMDPSFVAA